MRPQSWPPYPWLQVGPDGRPLQLDPGMLSVLSMGTLPLPSLSNMGDMGATGFLYSTPSEWGPPF